MNKTRRMLATLLALCLTVGAVPFAALSATTEEELANRKNSGSSVLLDTTVNAVSDYVATAAADTGAPEKPEDGTTTGNPFLQGTGGSNSFRIPALVTLSDGTLVAAADARWNTTYDGGGLDTIVSRSTDGGANWSYTFANYLGDNLDEPKEYNGSKATAFIDPALAVTADDTIYMLVDLYPYGIALNGNGTQTKPSTQVGFNSNGKLLLSTDGANYSYYLDGNTIYDSSNNAVSGYTVDAYFNIYQNGTYKSNLFFSDSPFKVVRTGFLYLTKSTDKGKNWSKPTLLNLKTDSEMACLVGPGRGLVTNNGTIVFPVYSYGDSQKMGFVYSTDNGATWKRSDSFTGASWSSEAMAVELSDGTLRFFYRNGTAKLCYADYNWTTGAWSAGPDTGIATNSNTQLSTITYSKTVDGKQVILVSCPTGPNAGGSSSSDGSYRTSGKIFAGIVNADNSITWKSGSVGVSPVATAQLSGSDYTAAQGFFAYSCMTEQKNGSVSILYEDNQFGWGAGDQKYYTMSFKTFTESELEAAFGVTFDEVIDVQLEVGEKSQTYTVEGGNYADTAQIQDDKIAAMTATKVETVGEATVGEAVSVVMEGKYIIYTYLGAYVTNSAVGKYIALSTTEQTVWNMVVADGTAGTYYITDSDGKYLYVNNGTAGVTETQTAVKLVYGTSTDGPGQSGFFIQNADGGYNLNNSGDTTNAYGKSGANGSWSRWQLKPYEVTTDLSTEVFFTGVASGTTTALVGYTQYNITVLGELEEITVNYMMDGNLVKTETIEVSRSAESVTLESPVISQSGDTYLLENTTLTLEAGKTTYDVTVRNYEIVVLDMYVGETLTYQIPGKSYGDGDIDLYPNAAIAGIDPLSAGTVYAKKATSVDAANLTHGRYVIVNATTDAILTDTYGTSGGDWGNRDGLARGEGDGTNEEELWWIVPVVDETTGQTRYIVSQDGKCLAIAGYYAGMSDRETLLVLEYTTDGWKLYDDTTYQYDPDGKDHLQGNYYLHDGLAYGNYQDCILGSTSTDGNLYWNIYKIEDDLTTGTACTDVTFTGVDSGTATTIIGEYKIFVRVHDREPITINYKHNGQIIKTETRYVTPDTKTVGLDRYIVDAQDNVYSVSETTLKLWGKDAYDVEVTPYTTAENTIEVATRESVTITAEGLTDGQYVTWHTPGNSGTYVGVSGGFEQDGEVWNPTTSATVVGHAVTAEGIPAQVVGLVHSADGSVVGTRIWNVNVTKGQDISVTTTKTLYLDVNHIEHSTVYYSVNGGPLQEITDNMLEKAADGDYYKMIAPLYNNVSYTGGFQITIFVAPDEGYALTKLGSTGSAFQYYSLVGEHPYGVDSEAWPYSDAECTELKNMGMQWGLKQGNLTADQVKAMYADAIAKGCTGLLCFTKNDPGDNLNTTVQAYSEKIATVSKTVDGILGVSRVLADYRRYAPGMIAGTDELVYFKITVTQEIPHAWQTENPNKGALVYENTVLVDKLENSYFYTKEWDQKDDKYDGIIQPENLPENPNEMNITEDLNAEWTDAQKAAGQRVHEYYVLYEIQEEDIPKYTIENEVVFNYSFKSSFSEASQATEIASTLAAITVVTTPMNPVIIDFTQPITIPNLTNEFLKYAFVDGDVGMPQYEAPKAKYGTVNVTKEEQKNPDGSTAKDNDGVIRYNYTVTYTPDPTKGIMLEADYVEIYGLYVDPDTKLEYMKVINAFPVYPATTIYYEEDYVTWDSGWSGNGTSVITDDQMLDYAGDTVKKNNYGYDPVYEGSNEASNGTEATTSTIGAAGTFDFTGTGFEIYANCTEDTGYVMVLVKSNTTGQMRLYTVNTKVGAGETSATENQKGNFYSVPIVSVQDLSYGSYNVRIVKSTDYDADGKPMEESKPVMIDGVRIFRTMDPLSGENLFSKDGEAAPSFVELRDLVLTGVDVVDNLKDYEDWVNAGSNPEEKDKYSMYSIAENIKTQVYEDTGSLAGAILISNNPEYVTDNDSDDGKDPILDLLENGPKNELYLWPGQAVTFTLEKGVTAQIGMKTVSGNKVDYTYSNDDVDENCEMNSSTDMFYHNADAGAITITNKSIKDSEGKETNGVLSITLLKYWNATTETLLAEVSESQIAYALMSLRELPAKEAVLHVTAVDYTGEEVGSVRLSKPGAEGEYAVFTREELLAQLPDGYLPVDEVIDIQVAYGEELAVTARIGKVATLKVEYVRLCKHGEVTLGGKLVPVMGKKTLTATLTKVQTGTGDAVFTAQEIWAAAPAGAVLHGLSDIQVAYGQTELISVFDTQSANSQVVPSIKL